MEDPVRFPTRSILIFLAGVLIGAMVGGVIVGRHWIANFWDWQLGGVADQANVAREIYAGRSKQLADRIRESLPTYVADIERERPGVEGKEWAYWIVRDVYEVSGEPVPASLKPVLSALPSRATCKQPVRKAGAG